MRKLRVREFKFAQVRGSAVIQLQIPLSPKLLFLLFLLPEEAQGRREITSGVAVTGSRVSAVPSSFSHVVGLHTPTPSVIQGGHMTGFGQWNVGKVTCVISRWKI